jgi:hypothetical protein
LLPEVPLSVPIEYGTLFPVMPQNNEVVVRYKNLKRLLASDDRRREPRFMTDTAAILHTLNPASNEAIKGQLLNISEGGLAVRLSCGLVQGTEVQIICGKLAIVGRVRYSKSVSGGFSHGVAIEEMITLDSVDTMPDILSLATVFSPSEELLETIASEKTTAL